MENVYFSDRSSDITKNSLPIFAKEVEVKLSLCLIKHYTVKMYVGVKA
jgi:hypothetical protein